MSWREFEEFIDKVEEICAKPLGFEKRFVSKPWDLGSPIIKKGKTYVPASFLGKVKNVEEFESCVLSIASEYGGDVLIRPTRTFVPKGDVRVFIYFPTGRDYISPYAIEATDLEEVEEYLRERGIL